MKKISLFTILIAACFIGSCEKKLKCTDFKSGTFLIAKDSTFKNAHKAIRTDGFHTQISPSGDSLFAKIKWINDCSYKLTYDKNKMHLSPFQLNVNRRGGILVEFGQPINNIMPYVSVLKGETKTETYRGFLKKTNK